jgi:hypothetical protein
VIGHLGKNILRDKEFPQANEINCVLSADFGAPDGQTLDLEAGLADADGHRLTILAAGAYAGIEREVVADHEHAPEYRRSIANQCRAVHRRGDLAVLDEIGLCTPEDMARRIDGTC